MVEYKLINAYVFNPAFKNVKARCELLYCNNSDNCEHYKKGKCVNTSRVFSSIRCPHSKTTVEEGYTQRAMKFYSWQNERKEKYKDVLNVISFESEKLVDCGDYVYLPYSHMSNYVNSLPFIEREYFCKKEEFTLENILEIINLKPRALMGGVITKYRDEVIKFLHHLKEEMPDKFGELQEDNEELVSKYLGKEINYVGRTAFIRTLKVGAEIKQQGNSFIWDGTKLTCENYKSSFLPFKIREGYLEIEPTESSTFKITDNNQVDENTKFKD